MGWKGKAKTSMLSSESEARYFREMIKNFREREELFFCELTLNGEIISSTCNLKCANKGYAFKISWNPKYRKFSPGILNEVEFLKAMDSGSIKMRFVDSGASATSYIRNLWLDRTTLITGLVVFRKKYIIAVQVISGLRKLKRFTISSINKLKRDIR